MRRNIFGPSRKEASKQPVARRLDHERTLCDAISKRLLVRLRYDDDTAERLFAPYGVYQSTTSKILVTGIQVENPADPQENREPRNLEVGKIRTLTVTGAKFVADVAFNFRDKRYQRGFICRL